MVSLDSLFHAVQGRAVGSHEARDVGADDLHPHLLFKGPENGLVIKRAPLHHHMTAQLLRRGGPDHLVDGVFHHRDGQSRGDVFHGGAVLLGLLHTGVHKHRAPAAQIHGPVRKQAQLRKVLHIVAQRLGEGLQKAAAAGRTGFVEENVADGAVFDLEALHVLTADVDDEVHIRHKMLGGGKVGDGLHYAEIRVEGGLGQILAVAGGGDGRHVQLGMALI